MGPQGDAAGASPSSLSELVPGHLSPVQQRQLTQLLESYKDMLSRDDEDSRQTPVLEHTTETQGHPVHLPYCRQNPTMPREEAEQVQQKLESGVIRPSNSPWSSLVVMVRKKDSKLRFRVVFRQLTVATVKDMHPLPRINDLLDPLHGTCWFSTLDLKSGYWQVTICEADKLKTAFRTSSGQLYEFNQVPFGLCNTPETFSRLMDHVLTGHTWEKCLFYLDDIIMSSKTWGEHLQYLEGVFQRLREAKLKLGANKCTLAAPEVSYLGHCITRDGLLPDPMLLRAIREMHTPQKVK